ncbi:AAA family ATPase [Halalkalibacter urbisdiaboli]|uniref:AAA family ATPase n=1 Tax=Halalkalibacter urbisdiaboli TaxID=1960589 RepID=UPI000B4522D7|nr:AAA family ATPase [Halalkalibacter urbisdiaboli]
MKVIIVFGPQAVGKMTVGRELENVTGLKLFHNHMTLELLYPFFGFSSETWRLSTLFRKEIFKVVSENNTINGLIFTFVWAFDQQEDWDFVEEVCEIFESNGGEIYFVELEAEIEARLERNRSPYRLEHKLTKRNIEQSELELKNSMQKYRLNSNEGEIQKENYMKINNTTLSPEETAQMIKKEFRL